MAQLVLNHTASNQARARRPRPHRQDQGCPDHSAGLAATFSRARTSFCCICLMPCAPVSHLAKQPAAAVPAPVSGRSCWPGRCLVFFFSHSPVRLHAGSLQPLDGPILENSDCAVVGQQQELEPDVILVHALVCVRPPGPSAAAPR